MTKLVFVAHDAKEFEIEADVGESLMMAAVRNGVPGILGECGGSLACCTCHVVLDDETLAKVGQPEGFENDMLDMTAVPRAQGSRLCCQVTVTDGLDGARIQMPETQL